MDFPTLLVVATLVTGLIWAADVIWLRQRRRERATEVLDVAGGPQAEELKEPAIVEYSRSFFPIILAVLLVRSFVVEPFRIPSGSMMPTLLIGDFILVNKFAYGLRLPVVHTQVLDLGEPERGDIVVFRYPENPEVDYIKRVVGVPGDHVVYRDKVLYVNGERMEQQMIGRYVGEGSGGVMTGASRRLENLNGLEHDILVVPGANDYPFELTVPEGEYFVMGDNRDNSRDSRYWGTVPEANLVGKAFFIWMHWDAGANEIDWGRIGSGVE